MGQIISKSSSTKGGYDTSTLLDRTEKFPGTCVTHLVVPALRIIAQLITM